MRALTTGPDSQLSADTPGIKLPVSSFVSDVLMRKLSLLTLITLAVFLSSCSFSTDLAVINHSDRPVVVKYRFKEAGGFYPETPAIKSVAEIDAQGKWLDLSTQQYEVDSQVRTVTLTLAPRTAVRLAKVRGPGLPKDENEFPIAELVVRGEYGTISLYGHQVKTSFAEQESVYAVSYR